MSLLREPLLHFLILGGVAYAAATQLQTQSTRYEIDAGAERRARLVATYQQQYGVDPTPSQVEQLLDQYVRSEILYREGLALGLERDDEIVRRRVVQKIEFVNEDVDVQGQPNEAQLSVFFKSHRDRYNSAPTVSFQHIFLSADAGGESVAKARAERILLLLKSGLTADSSDPFAEGQEFRALSRTGANALFGDSQLSEALFAQPTQAWTGPYRSAYGWHLVRISNRQDAQAQVLEAVRPRVIADYLSDLRAQRNLSTFRRIASKYRIVNNEPRA